MQKTRHIGWVLSVGLLIAGCTVVTPSPTKLVSASLPVKILSPAPVQQTLPLNQVEGQVHSHGQNDELTFLFVPPPVTPGIQSLDFNQLAYLRVWVQGYGIANSIWNGEGYVPVQGIQSTHQLRISYVPKGKNRIVAAQGYDRNQQPIPGFLLKAYYSSPTERQGVVKVYLSWRFTTVAEVLEHLLRDAPGLVPLLDVATLQSRIEQLIYPQGVVGSYQTHPSRFNSLNIAQQINALNGNVPAVAQTATWLPPAHPLTLHVRNAQGNVFNTPINVKLFDPASSTATVAPGAGLTQIPAITPGEWRGEVTLGNYTQSLNVTMASNGQVTMAQGSTIANPLKLPPLITQLDVTDVDSTGLIHRWQGDGNVLDTIATNHLTLQGGLTYQPSLQVQGFNFDGLDDTALSAVNANPGANGTLLFWFRRGNLSANQGLVGLGANGTFFIGAGGLQMFNGTSNSGAVAVNDTDWHQAAFTWGGGNASIYLDGALGWTGAYTLPAGGQVRLGAYPGGTNFFKGEMDDVQLYNTTLAVPTLQALAEKRLVTLHGDGFHTTPGSNSLQVGGAAVTVQSSTATAITGILPANQQGLSLFEDTVAGLTGSRSLPIPPSIRQLDKTVTKWGQTINLKGWHFGDSTAKNSLAFNGTAAPNLLAANTESVSVTVPNGATSGTVALTTAGGTAVSVPLVINEPRITAFESKAMTVDTPNKKALITKIKVNGQNLDDITRVTDVKLNGNSVTFTVTDDNTLVFDVPAGTLNGNASITVTNPFGSHTLNTTQFVAQIPNIISYWSGDANANDLVGPNNGTLINGATAGTAGKVNGTYHFTTAYESMINLTNVANFNWAIGASFAFEAWVRKDAVGGGAQVITTNYTCTGPPNRASQMLSLDIVAKTVGFGVEDHMGVNGIAGYTLATMEPNVFYHLLGVRDRVKVPAEVRLYLNGALVATGTDNTAGNLSSNPVFRDTIGAKGICLSRPGFGGDIDEPRVWGRALTDLEAKAIYDATK